MDDRQKMLQEYLMNKYSDEARNKTVEESQKGNTLSTVGAALAGFGANTAGRDGGSVSARILDDLRNRQSKQVSQFDKGREQVLKDYLMSKNDARYNSELETANQRFDAQQDFRNKQLDQRALDREEARADRKAMFNYSKEEKKADREENRKWRVEDKEQAQQFKVDQVQAKQDEKNKESVKEIEIRRQNIVDNIGLLKKMISEDGTYELFGPHNANLDRKVDNIAVDMAKLTDPNSVARPSEVEMFKKGLIESNMASTSNSTALKILDEFEKEVGVRMEKAYSIRGLENPASKKKEAPSLIALQAPNGKIIRVPEDKVDEAVSKGAKMISNVAGDRKPQSEGI